MNIRTMRSLINGESHFPFFPYMVLCETRHRIKHRSIKLSRNFIDVNKVEIKEFKVELWDLGKKPDRIFRKFTDYDKAKRLYNRAVKLLIEIGYKQ